MCDHKQQCKLVSPICSLVNWIYLRKPVKTEYFFHCFYPRSACVFKSGFFSGSVKSGAASGATSPVSSSSSSTTTTSSSAPTKNDFFSGIADKSGLMNNLGSLISGECFLFKRSVVLLSQQLLRNFIERIFYTLVIHCDRHFLTLIISFDCILLISILDHAFMVCPTTFIVKSILREVATREKN